MAPIGAPIGPLEGPYMGAFSIGGLKARLHHHQGSRGHPRRCGGSAAASGAASGRGRGSRAAGIMSSRGGSRNQHAQKHPEQRAHAHPEHWHPMLKI